MGEWLKNSSSCLATACTLYSSGNLHSLLFGLGKLGWLPGVSIAVFLASGLWVYRVRRAPMWILMGVAALVSRFYT